MNTLSLRTHVFSLLLSILLTAWNAQAQPVILTATDGTAVEILRDDYGVPHITAESETGMYFGQGFAIAEDRLYQMESYRRTSEGKLAEWLGVAYLPVDQEARRMMYTPAERTAAFENMPIGMRNSFEAFRDGVNLFLDSMEANPARYKPLQFATRAMERWTVEKSVAIAQYIIGVFGQNGGEELTRLVELQSNGLEWFEQNRPINDPSAPTTIHAAVAAPPRDYRPNTLHVESEVAARYAARRAQVQSLAEEIGLPPRFGSFAVAVSTAKSATGNPMLLGCPQMGAPSVSQANTVHEVELECPTFHAGGMTIAGVPGLIIGRNEHLTWTLTSGYTDNCDIYVDSTESNSYGRYFHNGEWLEFETYVDTIFVSGNPTVFTHYRTIHGPVVEADLANHQVFSLAMTFRYEELGMGISTNELCRAQTMEDAAFALMLNPMSFNAICAADDGRIGYWHIGKYQDRADGVDPRLPHRGDGSEEWAGFLGFDDLPHATGADQDYFCNWNNKPALWWNQGDNVPWVGADHVTAIENFVGPIAAMTYAQLKNVPQQIHDHGTYQQAMELSLEGWNDESIVPPGQSGFVDLNNTPSPHKTDQWPLHQAWQFKDMIFGGVSAVDPTAAPAVPARAVLENSYPNPFNPRATLRFSLPRAEVITIAIFDVEGRLVRTLADERFTSGEHAVAFDGSGLASGIYFARFSGESFAASQKLLLVK